MNRTEYGAVAVGSPNSIARIKANLEHVKALYAAAREGGESERVITSLSEQIVKLREQLNAAQ